MKDPYKVLGLDSSASQEELQAKYNELHDLYGEQRFASGEEGNEGARKLQELEEAWDLICAEKSRDTVSVSGDTVAGFDKIDMLIRDGKYNEAQDMLDSMSDRRGEWHYMQAIVFYKREWLSDAKTQLEMALRDDPNNAKYRNSLDKLNMAMGMGQNQRPVNPGNNQGQPVYGQPPYNGNQGQNGGQIPDSANDMSNCLSTCCMAYCLTDCLCNAMRCC